MDEFRYHESLVHPAMSASLEPPKEILVLGGGDGFVARELLKYDSVERIDVVDIDPSITQLAKERPEIRHLNKDSLFSEKVSIVHQDAMLFLQESTQFYDLVVIDLPDPNTEALSKLYSTAFYALVYRRLSVDGAMVTQATSPFFANKAFWCIVETMETALSDQVVPGTVYPYHVNVPSFGEWGFVLGTKRAKSWDQVAVSVDTRFLTTEKLASLFIFGKDIARVESEANQLLRPVLFHYYRKGWSQYH